MSTSSIGSYFERPVRRGWHVGDDGIPWRAVHSDDIRGLNVDLTDALASAETVASVSWDASGITVSGAASTSTGYSGNLSGIGTATATVTLSTGRIIVQIWRHRGIDAAKRSDYGAL